MSGHDLKTLAIIGVSALVGLTLTPLVGTTCDSGLHSGSAIVFRSPPGPPSPVTRLRFQRRSRVEAYFHFVPFGTRHPVSEHLYTPPRHSGEAEVKGRETPRARDLKKAPRPASFPLFKGGELDESRFQFLPTK